MAFLLLLVVFLIDFNAGRARPMTNSGLKIISMNGLGTSSDNNGFRGDGKFRLPTVMEQGLSITINGILETNDNSFMVVLHDNNETNEDCRIQLNIKEEMLNVTPGITDYETAPYNFDLQTNVPSRFSLRLIPRMSNHGKEMLAISFQINEEGESPQLICDIKNFESISFIEMREGVAHVDSLLFEFKKNH